MRGEEGRREGEGGKKWGGKSCGGGVSIREEEQEEEGIQDHPPDHIYKEIDRQWRTSRVILSGEPESLKKKKNQQSFTPKRNTRKHHTC